MKFTVNFNCDNASFEENCVGEEISNILKNIAKRVENNNSFGNIMDSNGNKIGKWELK